ncbi:MAG: hypothetical protein ABFC96_11460 [Thermoguttaceae bacterium]
MKPDQRFLKLPKHFWANVRTISQKLGYTERAERVIKVPSLDEIQKALLDLGLESSHLLDDGGIVTPLGQSLQDYFEFRADILNNSVERLLMTAEEAAKLFAEQKRRLRPSCPVPMNKQKGKMRAVAYFTALINMLIEANAGGYPCDFDPRELTTVTVQKAPLRTLARRVDGAFPSAVNPLAVWEIKEYYYTTTFGSRVADGVYETLLDGMELEELREHEKIDVKHYLMIDAHYTWWDCGKSYLCRIIDMLHMGYVDEVLFGREVTQELPRIVKEWVTLLQAARVKHQ